jgi:hypothetical protein
MKESRSSPICMQNTLMTVGKGKEKKERDRKD